MTVWYAALCKPRRERVAQQNLDNQGYHVFLPLIATQRRRNGRLVDVIEPLFPRYLFLAATEIRQSLAPARSTLGVTALVRFGAEMATIPSSVIESLRAMHDPESGACMHRRMFEPGMKVQVRTSDTGWMEGIFDCDDGDGRVVVLLDFLGKINKVKVSRDWLAPAA